MIHKKPFGIVSVDDRLRRMQGDNFRSIPIRQKKPEVKTVDNEIEEFKKKAWINPATIEDSKVKERLERLRYAEPVKLELDLPRGQPRPMPKPDSDIEADSPHLIKIRMAMGKVEDMRKKMSQAESFLSFYYDLQKLEQALKDAVREADSAGIIVPSSMRLRVQTLLERRK